MTVHVWYLMSPHVWKPVCQQQAALLILMILMNVQHAQSCYIIFQVISRHTLIPLKSLHMSKPALDICLAHYLFHLNPFKRAK